MLFLFRFSVVCILLFLATGFSPLLKAAPLIPANAAEAARQHHTQWTQQQQREQQLYRQLYTDEDIRLDNGYRETEKTGTAVQEETPCFPIRDIRLEGELAEQFQFALHTAIKQSAFVPGQCLGEQSISRIMHLAQNALIGKAYTTSRIVAAPQDLTGGHLVLTVIPGRIGAIRLNSDGTQPAAKSLPLGLYAAFPGRPDKVLNLHDLEQALENLKRVPATEAVIRIVPAERVDESDVEVSLRRTAFPFRFSLYADDSGSRQTGKYQGGFTLSADNPLGLNDLFYVSLGRDLGHKRRLTDQTGHTTGGRTRSYALHYSVPWGKWQWILNHQYYRYHQAVAAAAGHYDYNGRSRQTELAVSRLLHRDARSKTHLTVKWWARSSRSFINDAEIEVQHRRTAGWSAHLNHKTHIGRAAVNLNIAYKRGSGWHNSRRAPEEAVGEGTSRMRIVSATADVGLPVRIGREHFAYEGRLHMQWNGTPLTLQDKLAIGGRYTVRGFDGETGLAAERGWYSRNEWIWHYRPDHQVYVGIDAGRVSGRSAPFLPGQTLVGGVMGLRGQIRLGGDLAYELFMGRPIHRPLHFRTADYSTGFYLNYRF